MDASAEAPGGSLENSAIESVGRHTLSRRQLLKTAGVGLAGVALAPIYAGCAPGQTTGGEKTLTIMQWNHFIPAYDDWFDKNAQEWGTKNNVKVTVDHVQNLELPGRLAGEAAGQTGHDIIQFAQQIQTFRYEKQLVDMSDVVNSAISQFGDPVKMAKDVGFLNGVWRGMPDFYIIIAPMVRDDLLQQVDPANPMETWENVRQFSRKSKVGLKNKMAGLAISNCNDANHNWRAIMWCYGASEVTPDGKSVNVDTPEFKAFLDFAKAFFQEGITNEVFAWDDVSDNRYLGSGDGAFIHDAISSIRSIQDSGKDDPKRLDLYNSISLRKPLRGPAGVHSMPDVNLYSIWNFTKNQDTAKQFLKDYIALGPRLMKESKGYNMPFYEKLFQKPMEVIGQPDPPPLGKGDKKYERLQDYKGDIMHTFGYPGPPNGAAQEVLAGFHIPAIVGQYVLGASLSTTLADAHRRLDPIYKKYK